MVELRVSWVNFSHIRCAYPAAILLLSCMVEEIDESQRKKLRDRKVPRHVFFYKSKPVFFTGKSSLDTLAFSALNWVWSLPSAALLVSQQVGLHPFVRYQGLNKGALEEADVRLVIKPSCGLPGKLTPQQAVSTKANLPCGSVCGHWDILLIVLKPGQLLLLLLLL